MLGGLGAQELLLIFLVALLLFGSKRIPDIARSLGKGVAEFKRAMQDTKDEINRSIDDAGQPPRTPAQSGAGQQAKGLARSAALPPPAQSQPPAEGPAAGPVGARAELH